MKYDLGSSAPVIGVIARYIEWKGIEYIVEAARIVLRTHPNVLFIFANARGDPTIAATVRKLPARSYGEIPFEPDLFASSRTIPSPTGSPRQGVRMWSRGFVQREWSRRSPPSTGSRSAS